MESIFYPLKLGMIMKADWPKENGFSIPKMVMNPLCNPWRNQIGKESTLRINTLLLPFLCQEIFSRWIKTRPKKAILSRSLQPVKVRNPEMEFTSITLGFYQLLEGGLGL